MSRQRESSCAGMGAALGDRERPNRVGGLVPQVQERELLYGVSDLILTVYCDSLVTIFININPGNGIT